MKPNVRLGRVVVVLVALVLVATSPAAAQSINKALIDNLNKKLLYVALPLATAVEFILIYTVYRYRNNDDPRPTEENRRLEITWTAVTAIILTFVGVASMVVLANPYISPIATDPTQTEEDVPNPHLQGAVVPDDSDAVEIEVYVYQWGWEFTYPGTNITTQNEVVIPADSDVYFHLTAREVIHAFYSPALGLKQDAIPGEYNTIRTNVTRPGTYTLYCAEFCGAGHARMNGKITVLPQDEYREWVGERRSANGSASTNTATEATDRHRNDTPTG